MEKDFGAIIFLISMQKNGKENLFLIKDSHIKDHSTNLS